MFSSRTIPSTRGGQTYRNLLIMGGVAAIVGIADNVRALIWLMLNDAGVSTTSWTDYLARGLQLAAWALVARLAYLGWRRNAFPPTWAVVTLPVLGLLLVLLQRYA